MPRAGGKNVGVPPLPGEDFLRVSVQPLSLDERVALRAIFHSPLWAKVWKNALTGKPAPLVPDQNPQFTGILANNQLHVMLGWELFRKALASQIDDPKPKPVPIRDTYPEGLQIVTPPKTP